MPYLCTYTGMYFIYVVIIANMKMINLHLLPITWYWIQRYYDAMKEDQLLVQAIETKDDTSINRTLERARTELEKEVLSLQTLHSTSHSKAAVTSKDTLNQPMGKPATSCEQEPTCTLPSFLLPFTAGWLYTRLLSKIAEYFEKKGKYEHANEVLQLLLSQEQFCSGSRGRWWERLALNSDYHLKKKEKVCYCYTMFVIVSLLIWSNFCTKVGYLDPNLLTCTICGPLLNDINCKY